MDKTHVEQKARLEGALAYLTHLSLQLHEGKLKTLKDLNDKLTTDAMEASGAISILLVDELKSAGCNTGLLRESKVTP